MPKSKPIIAGQKFGMLTALGDKKKDFVAGERRTVYLVKCECGTVRYFSGPKLRSNKSCGCQVRRIPPKFIVHGYTGTPIYKTWQSMMSRCACHTSQSYYLYGGRGIAVCERWRKFENFLADMGECPLGKSLDRYPDNNGNYEPDNCRWATNAEQSDNRRITKMLTFNGITKSQASWARDSGIDLYILAGRIRLGWSMERALTYPVRNRQSHG